MTALVVAPAVFQSQSFLLALTSLVCALVLAVYAVKYWPKQTVHRLIIAILVAGFLAATAKNTYAAWYDCSQGCWWCIECWFQP